MDEMNVIVTEASAESAGASLVQFEKKKPYEFRKLKATDLPLMMKIVSKIGLENITKAITGSDYSEVIEQLFGGNKQAGEQSASAQPEDGQMTEQSDTKKILLGINIVASCSSILLENLSNCEMEINKLLASVSSKELKDIQNMDLDIYIQMITDFCKKEEFSSFFSHAVRLLDK